MKVKTSLVESEDEVMFTVRSKSLVAALERAALLMEAYSYEDVSFEYFRKKKKHCVILRMV